MHSFFIILEQQVSLNDIQSRDSFLDIYLFRYKNILNDYNDAYEPIHGR